VDLSGTLLSRRRVLPERERESDSREALPQTLPPHNPARRRFQSHRKPKILCKPARNGIANALIRLIRCSGEQTRSRWCVTQRLSGMLGHPDGKAKMAAAAKSGEFRPDISKRGARS